MWACRLLSPLLLGGLALATQDPVADSSLADLERTWAVELGLAPPAEGVPHHAERAERLAILQQAEPSDLAPALAGVLPADAEEALLVAALDRLADRAHADLLRPISGLAARLAPATLQHTRTRDRITDALVTAARSDAAFGAALAEHRDQFPARLAVSVEIAQLAGGVTEPLAGWRADRRSVQELTERLHAVSAHPPAHEAAVDVLRATLPFLDHRSELVQARAADALATAGATEAVPQLVDLVRFGGPQADRAAQAALARLTDVRWAHDADAWLAWWEDERAWLEQELPDLAGDLVDGEPAAFGHALRACLEHPGSAHAVAEALADAIRHQEDAQAMRALHALGALPGPSSVDALLDARDDRREEIRAAAEVLLERRARAPQAETRPRSDQPDTARSAFDSATEPDASGSTTPTCR